MPLKPYLKRLIEDRATLNRTESRTLMEAIFQSASATNTGAHIAGAHVEIAAALGALAARGETPAEIAGFVDALRQAAVAIPLNEAERESLVDTCGTGGDLSGTFNISTAAALVAAAAGATVAKHGNRAVTSRSGSADVLEALGIPIDLAPEQAAASLRRHRFAFLSAPSHHPAMRAVLPIRKALGVRTVFNILGPLTNPAGARAQVMGVYAPHLVPLVAEAMLLLGIRHAMVVHGDNGDGTGLDEFSISGPTHIAEVRDGHVHLSTVTPEDVGLTRARPGQLQGTDAPGNARILQAIFAAEPGPQRDVVVLNAAAVLVTAGLAVDLPTGVRLAQQTIDRGDVTMLLQRLSDIKARNFPAEQ